jgi:predicted AAA+ superfamily ATPase
MLDRLISQEIQRTSKSILLLGPRQTGKSTLIRSLKPDLEINLARESEYLAFASSAAELEERIGASKRIKTVFVDEVQRLPSLLNTIQALLDETKAEGRPLKFYLTGSSARKLKRGQANLLPGRVLNFELGTLAASEVDYAMQTRKALELGCLPEPYLQSTRADAERILESYAGSYLKEEIQSEALSRNLEGFSRFLTTAAASSGQFLDFSKIANRAKVSRTSTVRYFELLEDTLIAYRLDPYPDAADADQVKHPKYYFFDPGVLNGLVGNFSASPDRIGNLFEHLLVCQFKSSARARATKIEVHGFRTRGGLEVDFVVKLPSGVWAIEAKATSHASESDAASLELFRKYAPKGTQFVVATLSGPERKLRSGTRILPWQKLLHEMGL